MPAGLIAGRVLAADTGRPVKRARVFVTAAELPGGRGMLTDDMGLFELAELPAGRYTLTVPKPASSRSRTASAGRCRPGTPLQLADGQEIKDIEFRLPRGSVIAGHVVDETATRCRASMSACLRYQYQQGERRLMPAGTAQTDDLGQYRIWGLMPGDYYVDAHRAATAIRPGGGPWSGDRWRPAGSGGRGRRAGGPRRRRVGPSDEIQISLRADLLSGRAVGGRGAADRASA